MTHWNSHDLKALKKAARAEAERIRTAAKAREPDAPARLRDVFMQAVKLPETRIISSYAPRTSEIDPSLLEQALIAAGHRLALPVMIGKGKPLAFRLFRPGDPLHPAGFGVMEPAESAPIVTPHVILAPLLAFDRTCNRLGYGGGYYDRTLSLLRREGHVLALGIAFAAQETSAIPTGPTDAPLDGIVTEKEAVLGTGNRNSGKVFLSPNPKS